LSAFLVVDKPPGLTSHDIVAIVRAVTGAKKVGHTGTLDPFATGVLPLALGGATRLIQFLDEGVKIYDATIRMGFATDTGDPTGQSIRELPLPTASEAEVAAVLTSFLGDRMQTPPAYSAVKFEGKPLYAYARKGQEVTVQARPVKIYDLRLVSYDRERLRIVITCSRGTYARVLADEIATALGTAGHLDALSRTRSGPFYLDGALTMPRLAEIVAGPTGRPWEDVLVRRKKAATDLVPWLPRDDVRAGLEPYLRRPIDALSHLPFVEVPPPLVERIRRGARPPVAPAGVEVGGRYLVVSGDRVLAVAEHGADGPTGVRVVDEA
jgi:tRNA pseudouridine55 synthase